MPNRRNPNRSTQAIPSFSGFACVGLALAGLVLVSAGCSSAPPPQLRDATVRAAERTDAGQVLEFRILADNPGPEALPLREIDYTLSINGREVFKGRRSAEATLRRFGTQEIRIPAVIPAGSNGIPSGEVDYTLVGSLTYISPGALAETLFDAEIRRPSVSFNARGTLPLTR